MRAGQARMIEAFQGCDGLTVTMAEPLPAHTQRLLDSLGVIVRIDERTGFRGCPDHGLADYEVGRRHARNAKEEESQDGYR